MKRFIVSTQHVLVTKLFFKFMCRPEMLPSVYIILYSKTGVKRPLKNMQTKDLNAWVKVQNYQNPELSKL